MTKFMYELTKGISFMFLWISRFFNKINDRYYNKWIAKLNKEIAQIKSQISELEDNE